MLLDCWELILLGHLDLEAIPEKKVQNQKTIFIFFEKNKYYDF